jgi:hypothetical protein
MGQAIAKKDDVRQAVEQARTLVAEALALLDQAGIGAQVGAHLDMALHRMRSEIAAA